MLLHRRLGHFVFPVVWVVVVLLEMVLGLLFVSWLGRWVVAALPRLAAELTWDGMLVVAALPRLALDPTWEGMLVVVGCTALP